MPILEQPDGRIAFSDTGNGDPVVMLHCTSASGSEWSRLGDLLRTDYRAIAPDQWGCGASDGWPGRRPFGLADEAAPVIAILQGLERPAHLVGHSYGGAVALRIARTAPDLLASLTLVEPSSIHVLRGASDAAKLVAEISMVSEAVAEASREGDFWGGMRLFVDYWSGAGAWAALPDSAKSKMASRLPKVLLDFSALLNEPCSLEAYKQVTAPTLLVFGGRSPGPSRRIVDMLANVIPKVSARSIPGAGHMSPVTHSVAVNAAVAGHLRQWRSSSAERALAG